MVARRRPPLIMKKPLTRQLLVNFRGRNRQILLCSGYPFVTLINQHDGDIFHDGVFAVAVIAYQPGFFDQVQFTFVIAGAGRTA
jgi:hypothetical protein